MPATVHVLRGNPSKKAPSDLLGELQPEVELPSAPAWIWPEARKEWRRLGAELVRYGLVSKLDRAALVLYVQAWAKMVWAEQQLARAMRRAEEGRLAAEEAGTEWKGGDGVMVPTANGNFTYSHHWVMGRRASDDVNRYLAMFGLSPSSRSRVATSDNRQLSLLDQPAGDDEWSRRGL